MFQVLELLEALLSVLGLDTECHRICTNTSHIHHPSSWSRHEHCNSCERCTTNQPHACCSSRTLCICLFILRIFLHCFLNGVLQINNFLFHVACLVQKPVRV